MLHVIRPAAGGMKRHLIDLLRYTDRSLFRLMVAGPAGDLAAQVAAVGGEFFPVPLKGELDPFHDLRAAVQLSSLLRQRRIAILHAHGAKAGLVGRLAGVLAGTPVRILTVHNSIFYAEWPGYKKRLFALAEGLLARGTNRIITVSQALRREYIAQERLRPEQVVTIYNGVDPEEFRISESRAVLRTRLGLPVDTPVVGTVARLAPQKGVRYLIEAAGLLPPGRQPFFVIVGDGPLRGELERLAAASAGGRFFFTGMREDLPALLNAFDLFVLPSVSEGFGLAALEAMAAALPVVATTVGGIPEVVVDGETGILVPPRDAAALAAAIGRLLGDPELAAKMGQAGRERVRKLFTVERMARAVMALYEEELARKGLLANV
ncbi:MAG: glycosyltransferase family 4 protein [Thermodesulfitimonas sp.]